MISLRHIEIFYAVYQSGSISGAARLLRVSQPSVSKVLRHTETLIGFKLFGLVKGRLVPTEEAHRMFVEAREVQTRVDTLELLITNLRRGIEGHIRIGALHAFGLDLIPAAVAQFREQRPSVSFEVRTSHSDQLVKDVFARACDIALTFDMPPLPRLGGVKLGTTRLVVLFHRDDWPDAPEAIAPEMLKGRQLIRLVNPGSVGTLINNSLAAHDVEPANMLVETYYVAAALVRRRAGVAIVDAFTARNSLTPELDFRPLTDDLRLNIYAFHLEDHLPTRETSDFLISLRHFVQMLSL